MYNEDSERAKIGLATEIYVESILKSGRLDNLLTKLGSKKEPRKFMNYDPVSLRFQREYSASNDLKNICINLGIDGFLEYFPGYPIAIDIKTLSKSSFKFELLKDSGSRGVLFNPYIKFLFFASEEDQLIYIVSRKKVLRLVIQDEHNKLVSLVPGETICDINKQVNKCYGQLPGSTGLWLACAESVIKDALVYKIDLRNKNGST